MSEPKRWKRSEALSRLEKIYGRDLGAVEADLLLPLLEELHGAWLPEEPELPRRLRVGGDGHTVRVIAESPEFGGHLFTAEGVLPAATARAMVALWNAFGPSGTVRQALEWELAQQYEQVRAGEEFVSVRLSLLTVLLAKPWEEKP